MQPIKFQGVTRQGVAGRRSRFDSIEARLDEPAVFAACSTQQLTSRAERGYVLRVRYPVSELPTEVDKVINVLIVDDHALVRRGIRQILEHHPLISIAGEADTAHVAVELVTSGLDVDVVLMDVKLPDFSGIEATKRIKANRPNVKIILLSAFGQEFLAAAIDAGADGYLLKSTSEFELTSAVRRAVTSAITVDPTLAPALFVDDLDLRRPDLSSDLPDPINREDGGGPGHLPAQGG